MGFKDFIKEAIEEENNKTPEQKQQEKEERKNKKLDKIYEQYKDYLLDDEQILFDTLSLKGKYLFLDKRILFHNDRIKKGIKQEYNVIPYKNIRRFTIEKAGVLDMDADIKLFLGGNQEASITLNVPMDSIKTINEILLKNTL
ncbi:MAG: PH domain-containing protein [Clostridium sporogenes]|nr:PH domain-containing protein [Clostridium sporogenes]